MDKLPDDKWVRKKNKDERTESISAEDLLEESPSKTEQPTTTGCTYITIKIENMNIKFLVDTGAEISVISDQLLRKLTEANEKLPTLPVAGLTVNGVVPNQATKIKKQIMARIKIEEGTENITFLVLDGLVEEGIIGNDFLESHEARIRYDTQRRLHLTFEGMDRTILFQQYARDQNTLRSVTVQVVREGTETKNTERGCDIGEVAQRRLDELSRNMWKYSATNPD